MDSAHAWLWLILLLGGCATTGVTDLQGDADVASLNPEQRRIWYAAEQLDDTIRKRNLVYRDDELTEYVQSILDRLYPEFRGTLQARLFDSPHLNAFCLPNGHIYFNTGLLARLDNEAQLATVLAHEAAHFIHQHSLRQRQSADGIILIGVGVELLSGIPLSGTLIAAAALSSYSQAHENEADRQGFSRLVESGYDPREAPGAFRKLLEEVEALDIDEPSLFSSHPKLEHRIASFDQLLGELETNGGVVNGEEYLRLTGALREQTLRRYLEMNNHKVLLLILNNEQLRDRYTRHPDYFLAEAYRLRGDEGDTELAVTALRKCIGDDSLFAPAHRSLGLIQMKQGEKEQAAASFSRYLSLHPDATDREYIEIYLEQLGH